MTGIQMDIFDFIQDPDTWSGKTSPEPLVATKGETSKPSSRKSSGSKNRESVMCLCLRKTSGPQPGLYTTNWGGGASHGEYMMHSTGESHKGGKESLLLRILTDSQQAPLYLALDSGEKPQEPAPTKLSEILETDPDPKYNLSAKACQGILRRAERRGKKLPEQLERALIRQAQSVFRNEQESQGGGKGILIQNERTGALSTLNNQSVFTVFDASRRHDYRQFGDVCETVQAAYGTGGNNQAIVVKEDKAICLQGNGIDRADTAGCNGRGWCEDVSYTLNTIDRPAVYAATLGADDYKEPQMVYDARGNGDGKTVPTLTGDHENRVTEYTAITCYDMQGFGDYRESDVSSACKARDYKDATDIVVGTFQNTGQGWWKESDTGAPIRCAPSGMEANVVGAVDCRNGSENPDTNGTLQAKPNGGQSLNCQNVCRTGATVRRLTPMECERLQGYPDHWTDIGEYTDTKGKTRKTTDSARYKALGNSIALPFWFYLLRRISAEYERPATLGSLFDGIGGFPLCWERCNGPGTALWASEIEEFPIAVTKRRFPE